MEETDRCPDVAGTLSECFRFGCPDVPEYAASNLFQLFKQRRIKNTVTIQKELIRLLLKGLYLLKHDKDLIFNSG